MDSKHLAVAVISVSIFLSTACNREAPPATQAPASSTAKEVTIPAAEAPPATVVSRVMSDDEPRLIDVTGRVPLEVYTWTSEHQSRLAEGETGATGIEVTETPEGVSFTALADGAKVPATMTVGAEGSPRFVPDAWRSGIIRIAIDATLKQTEFVGLKFTKPCGLWILDKGAVALDAEGVRVTDRSGRQWISKAFRVDGQSLNLLTRED
jgi:hypothetical protein